MDPEKKVFVDEIRKVHKDLRRQYQKGTDFNKIWDEHCKNDDALDMYAKSMQDLATVIWDQDCDGTHRIKWCVDTCKKYFFDGELETLLEKDQRRKVHFESDPDDFHRGPNPFVICNEDVSGREPDSYEKLRLLDVGSCYDPFRKYEEFVTVAIDLKPACETVHKCDFIKAQISEPHDTITKQLTSIQDQAKPKELDTLPGSYFHVVVFSLLLTYIPSPTVRWKCCEKAHKVLEENGLLLIITPDSSHQNKNAALMKKWKFAIEMIGFQRIKYSKDRHLHFMAFRKVPRNYLWDKRKIAEYEDLNSVENRGDLCLNIPQDFRESEDENSDIECENDDNISEALFNELPRFYEGSSSD